jgi:tryptophan synthase alpha subunit
MAFCGQNRIKIIIMAKIKISAKKINELSRKSGFSASFIYMALSFGITGAYAFFSTVKKSK